MVQIYLDENDIVRLDESKNGDRAREAGVNRTFLRMADQLEDLARLTIKVAQRRGRSLAPYAETVRDIAQIRAEIRATPATN